MGDTNNIQTPSTEPVETAPPDINPPDPETERLRAENIELKNSIRTRDAREQVNELLRVAEARSPELLFTAIQDDLQFDGDDHLANAAALVERLKRGFPEQFGSQAHSAGSVDAAAGTGRRSAPISADILARMTPAQIQKLDWDEVRRVLSER